MKVSIIGVKGYPIVYGGYETLIHSLSERLMNKNIELTIYCHSSLFKEKLKKVNGINLVYLPAIEKKTLSQLTHSFLSTLHACFTNADMIFYVNVANAPFGILPKLFNKKTIINVDGIEWQRPKWKGLGSVYYKMCARLIKYFFNKVITDAVQMQILYKNQFKTDSSVITYGSEQPNWYDPGILSRFNIISRDFYLVVGRMIPDNNLDVIIDEYILSKTSKKLVIIGDDIFKGSFALSIQNKIKGNKNVVLTGYVKNFDHLCTFYKNCFAYIHGHEFGGTNPTMITALNEGCFILSIDTPFTREMLDNGRHGIYFKKDKLSLANAISKYEMIDNAEKIEQLRNLGEIRVQENYNWDKIADKYYRVFNELNS